MKLLSLLCIDKIKEEVNCDEKIREEIKRKFNVTTQSTYSYYYKTRYNGADPFPYLNVDDAGKRIENMILGNSCEIVVDYLVLRSISVNCIVLN